MDSCHGGHCFLGNYVVSGDIRIFSLAFKTAWEGAHGRWDILRDNSRHVHTDVVLATEEHPDHILDGRDRLDDDRRFYILPDVLRLED